MRACSMSAGRACGCCWQNHAEASSGMSLSPARQEQRAAVQNIRQTNSSTAHLPRQHAPAAPPGTKTYCTPTAHQRIGSAAHLSMDDEPSNTPHCGIHCLVGTIQTKLGQLPHLLLQQDEGWGQHTGSRANRASRRMGRRTSDTVRVQLQLPKPCS